MKVITNDKKETANLNGDDLSLLKELGLDSFEVLGLQAPILKSIKRQRFEKPTAIQEKTIPLVLAGKDIMAGSATGTGKTLAFGAGIIQNSKQGDGIQALILTPTRELAEQVAKSLRAFSQYGFLRISAVYGGVPIDQQIKELRRADVVVGTPGRMLDHINRKTIRLDKVETLVLDEADTMLDMGFIIDVEKIIKRCPSDRQTLLFSATLTNEVNRLAKKHTKEPVRIVIEGLVDPGKLTQVYYEVLSKRKLSLLVHLLKHESAELVMVFCNTRRMTDFVTRNLKYLGIEAKSIHGGIPQDKRTKVIKRFHSKKVHVLICTDVAARGLDIKAVSHVYNYDIPSDSKQYIHRIGRTARAGKAGKAISLVSIRDRDSFANVLRDKSLSVTKEKTPTLV